MTTTVDLLQHIGLNKYEAEAYYTLLTHGSLTGYEVGKYSHVPLSRSYEILERLLEKGLALVQPGDPPHYSAQDPHLVFDRFRSTMETTLNTLATSLASLAHVDKAGEFWIVRGQHNILTQMRAMIAKAQATLDLILPPDYNVSDSLAQANVRGCRIFHASTVGQDVRHAGTVLLVCDDREALVGALAPPDSCQAVISSNIALLDALHGYFLHRQAPGVPGSSAESSRPHDVDWMDWEIRKQRHLRSLSMENRVA
jgi:predicted transcriptional regulator